MNTYPFIGKSEESGNIVLFSSKTRGECIKGVTCSVGMAGQWCENAFKNITAEYLANTYGEVKSKEHAEFIKMLADTNKIPCAVLSIDMNYTMFYVIDGCLFFCVKEIDVVGDYEKITIPLPPECESVGEWPRVGEVVLTASKSKAKVLATYNKKAWVEYVSGSEGFNTLNIASLSKPKTPEQELRDEISDLAFNQFNDDSYDLTHNSYYLAEQILSKYNITKKPQ